MSPPSIPIGVDDFREVREAGLEYVDKSDLIRQIVDRAGVKVLLFPRPRRFGKTLNLSMLRYWLSTSSNDLVHELLELYALELQPVFESLLEGGSLEVTLDENVVLNDIRRGARAHARAA